MGRTGPLESLMLLTAAGLLLYGLWHRPASTAGERPPPPGAARADIAPPDAADRGVGPPPVTRTDLVAPRATGGRYDPWAQGERAPGLRRLRQYASLETPDRLVADYSRRLRSEESLSLVAAGQLTPAGHGAYLIYTSPDLAPPGAEVPQPARARLVAVLAQSRRLDRPPGGQANPSQLTVWDFDSQRLTPEDLRWLETTLGQDRPSSNWP